MRRSFLLLPLLFCVSCNPFDFLTGGERRRLDRQRERWLVLGIRNYDFDYQESCFCPPETSKPVRIEVREGAVSRVLDRSTGQAIVLSFPYARWPTIDSLFVWTHRSLDNGYKIDITYDAQYHFPTRISGDYPKAIDDEYLRTAGAFVRR